MAKITIGLDKSKSKLAALMFFEPIMEGVMSCLLTLPIPVRFLVEYVGVQLELGTNDSGFIYIKVVLADSDNHKIDDMIRLEVTGDTEFTPLLKHALRLKIGQLVEAQLSNLSSQAHTWTFMQSTLNKDARI